jgi:glucosamine 6-phosphate synthetase-like amidotransferase/phosphosugar isomerase protein
LTPPARKVNQFPNRSIVRQFTSSHLEGYLAEELLAYHIAVRRGCDVDQPRNLAKSVTVE